MISQQAMPGAPTCVTQGAKYIGVVSRPASDSAPPPAVTAVYEPAGESVDAPIFVLSEKSGGCVSDGELRARGFRLVPLRAVPLSSFAVVRETSE